MLFAVMLIGVQPANATQGQLATGLAAPMTLSPPFGEHANLVAAMDAGGATKLVWDTSTGEGHSVQTAAIAPGGVEAGPVTTVGGGRRPNSAPALALAPAGRTAIAWFEERKTEQVWGDELLALKVRDQLPGGGWEPARTVWRPTPRSIYAYGGFAVATDDAGDEAVVWLTHLEGKPTPAPWTVMVSSRAAGGAFTKPTAFVTDSSGTQPAIGVNPGGEVTLLWCGPEEQQQLLTATWRAGASSPTSPTTLDAIDGTGPPTLHEGVSDLGIEAGRSGSELATWLKGPNRSNRLEAVALRAAWRGPGAAFLPTQTVTSPGVEAREPVVALNTGGGALIAWSEITSDGSGPDLNYATGAPGAVLAAGPSIPAALGEHPELRAARLSDGSALLLWRDGAGVLADRWLPGEPVPPAVLVRRLGEESVQLAAGGASSPVLAWIGRTPTDSAAEAVRYLIAGGLSGFPQIDPVPVLALTGSKRLVRQQGIAIRVRCAEACALTAAAQVFGLKTQNAEEASGGAYHRIGSFLPLHRSLRAQATEVLKIRSTRKLLRAYCRSARRQDLDAVEVRVSVRSANGVGRHFVLGEQPNPGSCPR